MVIQSPKVSRRPGAMGGCDPQVLLLQRTDGNMLYAIVHHDADL